MDCFGNVSFVPSVMNCSNPRSVSSSQARTGSAMNSTTRSSGLMNVDNSTSYIVTPAPEYYQFMPQTIPLVPTMTQTTPGVYGPCPIGPVMQPFPAGFLPYCPDPMTQIYPAAQNSCDNESVIQIVPTAEYGSELSYKPAITVTKEQNTKSVYVAAPQKRNSSSQRQPATKSASFTAPSQWNILPGTVGKVGKSSSFSNPAISGSGSMCSTYDRSLPQVKVDPLSSIAESMEQIVQLSPHALSIGKLFHSSSSIATTTAVEQSSKNASAKLNQPTSPTASVRFSSVASSVVKNGTLSNSAPTPESSVCTGSQTSISDEKGDQRCSNVPASQVSNVDMVPILPIMAPNNIAVSQNDTDAPSAASTSKTVIKAESIARTGVDKIKTFSEVTSGACTSNAKLSAAVKLVPCSMNSDNTQSPVSREMITKDSNSSGKVLATAKQVAGRVSVLVKKTSNAQTPGTLTARLSGEELAKLLASTTSNIKMVTTAAASTTSSLFNSAKDVSTKGTSSLASSSTQVAFSPGRSTPVPACRAVSPSTPNRVIVKTIAPSGSTVATRTADATPPPNQPVFTLQIKPQ